MNADSWIDELVQHGVCTTQKRKTCEDCQRRIKQAKARIKQEVVKAQIANLKMILQSAEDQEKASGRRWSRGTFILAMTELIDDLEQELEENSL